MSSTMCARVECEREARSRGLCHKHYMQARRAGFSGPAPRPTVEQRFWNFVVDAGDCWEWIGNKTTGGYGQFGVKYGASPVRAHRFAYEQLIAEIPAGLQLDHLCRNRLCVNPWHLDPVPGRVNTLRSDGITARNARKTECPQGHEYTFENTYTDPRGRRSCRVCRNRFCAEYKARRKAAA